MRTRRGFDRLLTFSDGVVAIALTLLVLPLTEIVRDNPASSSVGQLLRDHTFELGTFALSFTVIWAFWASHHAMMEYFDAYDQTLLRLTVVWLFTIVALPFVTQLLAEEDVGAGGAPYYDGILLTSALALAGMSWHGHRTPQLLRSDRDEATRWLATPVSVVTPIILFIAFVLSIVLPQLGMWPLLALLLSDYIERPLQRLRRRA